MDRIINYARGTHIHSATVRNVSAPNFKAFADNVLNDRAKARFLQYICPPMSGVTRNGKSEQPCAFLGLDYDEATPESYKRFLQFVSCYQAFWHTTARHTTEKPRVRGIIALNRDVTPQERERLGYAVHNHLKEKYGIVLDTNAYSTARALFTPLVGAESGYFDGEPLKVEDFLTPLPEQPTTPPTHEKPQSISEQQNDKEFDRLTLLNQVSPQTFIDLQSALNVLPADDYGDWLAVAMALAFFKDSEHESRALALFHAYSEKSAKYDSDIVNEKWESLTTPDNTSYKAIFAKAQGRGWVNPMAKMLNVGGVDKKSSPDKLARAFIEHLGGYDFLAQKFLIKQLYKYNGCYWALQDEGELAFKIGEWLTSLNIGYSARKINEISATMLTMVPPMKEGDTNVLAFENCVINRRSGEVLPHKREYYLTSCLPYPYDTTLSDTPVFDKWLNFLAKGSAEKAQVLRAVLYMVLTNRTEWQRFIELTGPGGTGKSVFMLLAGYFVGLQNICTKSLLDLDSARGRAGADKALLVLSPDQDMYTGHGAGLKSLSGADLVDFDPKYIPPYNAKSHAVYIVSHNGSVNFTERNGGIDRRRVLILLDNVVSDDEKDFMLEEKLKAETGGIVAKLLKEFSSSDLAFQVILKHEKSAEAIQLKAESDHTVEFCSFFETMPTLNGLRVGDMGKEGDMQYFYSHYLRFCSAYGHKFPLSVSKFKLAMVQAFKIHQSKIPYATRRTKKGFITNVRLKQDDDLDLSWLENNDFKDLSIS
ncbi:hypothetical protein FHQ26_09540 [Testudinibacter sp. TR-2022]|uniref:PriCT-2 domain-containing protein n=1 Tax=Testudinibacter sp. TR-2022 TaxID=2585029 RepID=UPI00111ADBFF|nr:PriCT-2 domain-containing protein [Testudinibacter sp. TR-2022]TNH03485.1 hypothetical protein FHQ22_07955 [Pasteurellaceae bacterium Phil31]TNH07943.1 hypothetical protein FHQ26_09540 [Testudinibacter sp. TR-2022]TNH10321.1 hypothetical protein FHQ25_05475 [Testudinibacter sp. TR-2022]